jgi:PKD repeat protein
VAYAWNFGDGQTGTGANATHTYSALGTYTAVVTATNTVDVVTQTTSITVTDIPISGLTASNNSPTTVYSATLFTASIVTGTNVVYAWNFGDGQTGSGATPSHAYTAVGSYTAVLTATNSAGAPVTTTTAVTITDIPVTGLAAQNSSPTVLGNATFFTSTIVTGTNVTYAWNFGDGQTGSGATISHTYATFGTYTAIVTATNGTSNASVTTTVNVDVPASGLTAQSNSPMPSGSAVNLSATVSAGSRLTYAWDFGDGTTGAGANPTHAYGPIGVYTAVVTATNSVSSITATTSVTITEVPLSGIAASASSPTLIGQATAFTASVSVGSNPVFTWDFGDGQVGAGAHPTHTYPALGVYTAVVTATNSVNFITTTVSVTIEPYRIFMPIITRVSAAPAQVGPTSALPREPRAAFAPARRW